MKEEGLYRLTHEQIIELIYQQGKVIDDLKTILEARTVLQKLYLDDINALGERLELYLFNDHMQKKEIEELKSIIELKLSRDVDELETWEEMEEE